MFADDLVIFAKTISGLQTTLDTLSSYCKQWLLKINSDKTKVLALVSKSNLEWAHYICDCLVLLNTGLEDAGDEAEMEMMTTVLGTRLATQTPSPLSHRLVPGPCGLTVQRSPKRKKSRLLSMEPGSCQKINPSTEMLAVLQEKGQWHASFFFLQSTKDSLCTRLS